MNNNQLAKGLIWKLLERFGVQGIQFILQIILARLLDPEHYGVLSLMIIFTSLANVFIQTGFNTSLVQNRKIKEDDYSSVFWVSLVIAVVLYIILFFAAPAIAVFYKMPDIVAPFRVLALVLIPGALNSIQLAKVSRELDFKKVFTSNIGAVIFSGLTGIILAYCGMGIWALVAQNLLNSAIACVVMWFTVKWHPRFVCDLYRVKVLFSFGWKLLVSSLIDTLYQDLSSLIIGKKYDSGTLGYYNRGKQFPQFIINAINGAVQSVMLPAMSAKQDSKSQVKELTRASITLSSYIIFPIMGGLAGVATPLVELLLTEKWLPCVPFLQIFCFSFAFWPIHTSNLQAINAMGRSDIFLKLEIIKKIIGVGVLAIAVFCFNTPIAIAMTGCFTGVISCFINAYPNKKLIDYSYMEQMHDILPSFMATLVMFLCVWGIEAADLSSIIMLLIQIVVGVLVYLIISIVFKLRPFKMLISSISGRKS